MWLCPVRCNAAPSVPWKAARKVGEKGGIREVLAAWGIIGHDIFWAIDEQDKGAVAVGPLVETGLMAQKDRTTVRQHRAFAEVGDSGGVVAEGVDGGIGWAWALYNEHELAQDARLFKVAVGQGSGWVVGGHQAFLDVLRK